MDQRRESQAQSDLKANENGGRFHGGEEVNDPFLVAADMALRSHQMGHITRGISIV